MFTPSGMLSVFMNISQAIDVTGAVSGALDAGLLSPDEFGEAMASLGSPFQPR